MAEGNNINHYKTGILTLHYGSNYGAILQALTTARLFDAEIIDHRYKNKIDDHRESIQYKKHLYEYINNSLPLSKQFIADNYDDNSTLEYIYDNYNLVVYGGDEIWKVHYGSNSVFKLISGLLKAPKKTIYYYDWRQNHSFYTPFPNIYWPYSANITSIAFAGSIGQTNTSNIPASHKTMMAKSIGCFRMLSVRDLRTLKFFQELCPDIKDNIEIVPDPVFAFDISTSEKEEAEIILERNNIYMDKPYAFIYVRNWLVKKCKEEIKDMNMQVVNLNELVLTPPQWFAIIGMATCGISSEMHGLISSLVQNIPCLSIDRRYKSIELKEDFSIQKLTSLSKIMKYWPYEKVSEISSIRKEKVLDFVNRTRRLNSLS